MSQLITVGIADYKLAAAPDKLITYALGSCVGVCVYDPHFHRAGLAHILLPFSAQIQGNKTPLKFADTALPLMVAELEKEGSRRFAMQAKIAGGAQMFAAAGNSDIATIGARNVEAVKKTLKRLKIPIVCEQTGANYGRTLCFDPASFLMTIRSPKKPEWTG